MNAVLKTENVALETAAPLEFAALVKEGRPIEDIAANFGVSRWWCSAA